MFYLASCPQLARHSVYTYWLVPCVARAADDMAMPLVVENDACFQPDGSCEQPASPCWHARHSHWNLLVLMPMPHLWPHSAHRFSFELWKVRIE